MSLNYGNIFKILPFTGAIALALLAAPGVAQADEIATFTLTLEADVFTPADLKVPADKPFVLKVINKEKAGVEIEAKDLKVEKVVAAGGEAISRIKAMKPGRYLLVNEYKEDTVKTYVVVE
jgi:hypothetical protein